ncbi:hypothetical protein GGF41_004922, partial [Coemansia sp. RSA 2531]
ELAGEIRRQHSDAFEIAYRPDFRQAIADTWPRTMADEAARRDWGWNPVFGTADIVRVMLDKLGPVYATTSTPTTEPLVEELPAAVVAS